MADTLVSTLLDKLASTTYQYVSDEVKIVLNVKKEVEEFAWNLKAIESMLEDAERRQLKEANVQNWLDNLKEISYQMVDVLDEWNTDILRQQVEKQEGEGATHIAPQRKVSFAIFARSFCLGQVGKVIIRREIALKIKDLNVRLAGIYKQRKMYNFQLAKKVIQKQQTSSFVDISEIYGREKEKDSLIRKLVSDTSEEGRGLLIIPIVGMGGMGKTTLAQLAYNDAKVKAHFEKRVWVCVSEPFDEIKIAKAISDDTSSSLKELDHVLEYMSRSIKGVKFLLVLDDVWTEDRKKWDQLKLPLMQNGAKGSRILVTTRKLNVASMMRATSHMINLAELSEQNCLSIFNHMAFSDREIGESEVFGDISKEIVKKCKGLPLVAKTLGSMMRNKRTRSEWLDVLNSRIWDWEEVEQEVFQPLFLSYYDLAPRNRCCLLYCAIFPKDYELSRDVLINLWMAQDYLNSRENKDKGKIGHAIFDNLAGRSFFQDFEKDLYTGAIISCKMHDIVHDFVQFITKKECLITKAEGANEKIELLGSKVHHLTLTSIADSQAVLSITSGNCKNLRTLITIHSRVDTVYGSFISKLKSLRTIKLRLSYTSIEELPEEIGELVHLRHIDLSESENLKKLSDTICGLYNLYTLDLRGCTSLNKLPDNMRKLISLKHLYVGGCRSLEYLPKGIGRLTSLQTLDVCPLFSVDNDEAFQVGELGNLNQLRGSLQIRILGKVKDVSEAQLRDNKQLFHLKLDFGKVVYEAGDCSVRIMNVFRPHDDLEYLDINWNYNDVYFGSTFPNWLMSLNKLRFLILSGNKGCQVLPPLGKLPFLEELYVGRMLGVKKVGGEFLGVGDDDQTSSSFKSSSSILFPKLKRLQFHRLASCKDWEGVKGGNVDREITIMPCPSSLYIIQCFDLETLPGFLWKTPLQNLIISSCSQLAGRCKKGQWPKIFEIPNVEIDNF
ncbi:putative disease resistance protein RGA3 [Pyrus x bretschneideri]|uniref:putative disease resistance protein RGA3 n=1 Tax=Pyrus x bretschneideri TaxID=225117 RepID=UPI00202F7985|nr:putative disease resistance protein RGA3 [Pyrus x bretschneideri]